MPHLLEHGAGPRVLRSLSFQLLITLLKGGAQLRFQSLEFRLLAANGRQLVLYKIPYLDTRVGVAVLDDEKFAYLPQGKSQGLGAFHKRQAIDCELRKFSVTGWSPRWARKQSLLLVKAHCFQVDLGALRKLASCQSFHYSSVNPVDIYRVKLFCSFLVRA